MAITRPVTKTLISTTQWGIPITDEVNRLTDWQTLNRNVPWGRIASVQVAAPQNGIGAAATTIITCPFTAVAGRYYRASLANLKLYSNSAGICDVYINVDSTSYASINGQVGAGQFCAGFGFIATAPFSLAAGAHNAYGMLAINVGTINTANASNAPMTLLIEDIGPVTPS